MEAAVQSLLRSSEDLKATLEVEVTQLQERGDLASSFTDDRSKRILAVVSHRKDYVGDEEGWCVTSSCPKSVAFMPEADYYIRILFLAYICFY
jgi:predicted nucleic acid-binding Zn finger protein